MMKPVRSNSSEPYYLPIEIRMYEFPQFDVTAS